MGGVPGLPAEKRVRRAPRKTLAHPDSLEFSREVSHNGAVNMTIERENYEA